MSTLKVLEPGYSRERGENFLETMRGRYACKLFDREKPLGEDAITFLLECGRLSPSSFGLEPWSFFVLKTKDSLQKLSAACFDQDPVSSSPLAICILVEREASYQENAPFLRQRAERFPLGYDEFLKDYMGYHRYLISEDRILHWSRAQAYIALANMMTGAYHSGIDSCAIEGFDELKVLEILDTDTTATKTVAIIGVFGFSKEAPRKKIREPFDAIATYI
jgi:nitroreductase